MAPKRAASSTPSKKAKVAKVAAAAAAPEPEVLVPYASVTPWVNPDPVRSIDHPGREDTSGLCLSVENVLAASKRVEPHIIRTPCERSVSLSERFGMNVFLKRDLLQKTGSFKERGACNALLQLSVEERKAGVIAASAGNHATGLSFHAVRLGIAVTVVMPRTAPLTKVTEVAGNGENVGW